MHVLLQFPYRTLFEFQPRLPLHLSFDRLIEVKELVNPYGCSQLNIYGDDMTAWLEWGIT